MFKEFKTFAMRGNVIDLAIGVIIGGAFGKIVSSLVEDMIMPPLGLLTSGIDMSQLQITLQAATQTQAAVTINYGVFINSVINFLIISFVIFFLVRQINRVQKQEEATPAKPNEEILLLREIRDALQTNNKMS